MIDRAYSRLAAMREAARSVSAEVLDLGAGGTHQARLERDVRLMTTDRRLAALAVGEAGLCFGRTDGIDRERHYIGRVGISDVDNEQLVVDWRAPAAEAFYRATGGEPMGLVRRRHFILRGKRLLGLDDELLGDAALTAAAAATDGTATDGNGEGSGGRRADGLVLMGEGALIAALERSRTGRMTDIVATIQREQDEIVRAPLPGILVVQGGPGTGKTAVALHRAAYLLYTFRFPLERAGVLLVGPNRLFLRYVEQVLPALGEDAATLATPSDLVATEVAGTEPGPVAVLKGDVRMARFVEQAVRDRERALPRPMAVLWRGRRLVLSVRDSRRIVAQVSRHRGGHNQRRRQVERMVASHLARQLGRDFLEGQDRREVEDSLLAEPAVFEALERMWPVLSPAELLNDLFGLPALVRLAARDVLDPHESELLQRHRSRRARDARWTEADLPLLDEASVHLGPEPRTRRIDGDESLGEMAAWRHERVLDGMGPLDPHQRREVMARLSAADADPDGLDVRLEPWERTFGHVVVDEAQDLSPMQLRVLGRRCPGGSMTLVGDLGQATGPWAPGTWEEVVAHLPGRRPAHMVDLTVNYRTPAEVADLAAGVLAVAAPELTPSKSVREAGVAPVFTRVAANELVSSVAAAARAEVVEVAGGRVAVIAPEARVQEIRRAIPEAIEGPAGLDAAIAVLAVTEAKGLEFDSVCLVEPADIVEERPRGGRALYVALTRTTRRLHVVHSDELPAGMTRSGVTLARPDEPK